MLAHTVVTRPATTLRRLGSSQLHRRFIYPSGSQLQALLRPDTWLAKLRFRADGKPRSKLVALGFGSLTLFSLLSYVTLIETIEDDEKALNRLIKMIYVQQTDMIYDSVNFDDPVSTISYFKKLYLSFALSRSSEQGDEYINNLMTWIIKAKTRKDSKKKAEVQAQHIMRLAAEKIHGAFRELNRDSIPTTADFVMHVMLDALDSLAELAYGSDDEEEDVTKFFQIRNNIEKEAKVTKDYEVLG